MFIVRSTLQLSVTMIVVKQTCLCSLYLLLTNLDQRPFIEILVTACASQTFGPKTMVYRLARLSQSHVQRVRNIRLADRVTIFTMAQGKWIVFRSPTSIFLTQLLLVSYSDMLLYIYKYSNVSVWG